MLQKNCNNVFCLVAHQRICIFPAETLLLQMMLDPNFSSKLVSIFNVFLLRSLAATFASVAIFEHFPRVLDFLRMHLSPGDVRKEVGGIGRIPVKES